MKVKNSKESEKNVTKFATSSPSRLLQNVEQEINKKNYFSSSLLHRSSHSLLLIQVIMTIMNMSMLMLLRNIQLLAPITDTTLTMRNIIMMMS